MMMMMMMIMMMMIMQVGLLGTALTRGVVRELLAIALTRATEDNLATALTR